MPELKNEDPGESAQPYAELEPLLTTRLYNISATAQGDQQIELSKSKAYRISNPASIAYFYFVPLLSSHAGGLDDLNVVVHYSLYKR